MTRIIDAKLITDKIKDLFIKANTCLRPDILAGLKKARKNEAKEKSKYALDIIIKNAFIAKKKMLAICQDTGMAVVYLKAGQSLIVKGNLKKAVAKGAALAYKKGYFRSSVVDDPLIRKNTNTNLPPIIYTDIVPGNKINIKVVAKGFGCENVSKIRMFRPTDPVSSIEDFVVNTVKEAGSRPCPPVYIGIGMGGTLDKAVSLSREAIFRPLGKGSKDKHIARLEKSILKKVNNLRIGPAGVGGNTTALGVSILTYPTHIAGLPVSVNISCHATRTAEATI
ncbi:MAG: fumarate hydratase [Candidatus Omnitrophica bacterium CG_4_9_14_0_2_um_filter_42_8]|nr:MAG: fumarate hydratase [Candidatus Omnitrophica bacterium CG22_combo_CG10-13_8_21_14_all_43_16]PJC47064.1 MAG: fumarate hydratase [Candidatus Omnitrophica bacterium CG_4_9_14_0_2_um_filter_42_8]